MNFKKRTCKSLSLLMALVMSLSINAPAYADHDTTPVLPYTGIPIVTQHTSNALSDARGITMGSFGDLIVADLERNEIFSVNIDNPKNPIITTKQADIQSPVGLADDSYANLYVSSNHEVYKVTATSSEPLPINFGSSLPKKLVFNNSTSTLFGIKQDSISSSRIYSASLDGTGYTVYAPESSLFSGICIGPDGNLYVSDYNANKIIKVTGLDQSTDFITNVPLPTDIIFGLDGYFYVSSLSANGEMIIKYDVNGNQICIFNATDTNPSSLYVDGCGYIYYTQESSDVNLIVGSASTVDSTHIALTMNTSLDNNVSPDQTAFVVDGVASNPTVTDASISGSVVTLTLSSPIVDGDLPRVDYTVPGNSKLRVAVKGFILKSFAHMPVINNVQANQNQAQPTGLAGVAPTFPTGNGKITGTTTEMEFKLSIDSTYNTCSTDETTVSTPATYNVRFKAKTGYNAGTPATVTVPRYSSHKNSDDSSSDGSSASSSGGGSSTAKPTGSVVLVNGNEEKAGTETKTTVNGVTSVTLTVDSSAISKKIEEVLKNNTDNKTNLLEFSVGSSNNATVGLTGDIIKQLEKEDFNVSITKDKVEYVIPASEITIENVANILNVDSDQLKNIEVEVRISEVSADVLAKYNEIANKQEHVFVVPPVEFEIVAKATGTDGVTRETTVSQFSNYVERIIELPANVDQSKITTGIVFNPDGTYSHVPTVVFEKDGKYYAKLNSLTNSTYSVIYNPITVDTVKGHWSEETVNDMASRLVLIDYTNLDPDKAVTRAEFADYIVRALGLYREGEKLDSTFTDISTDSKYQVSIEKAKEWGIISGYPDGTFKADKTVTREEAMVMYAKAMDIANILENRADKLNVYTDKEDVSSWATPSVKRVVNAEIFNGKGNGVLAPKDTLTKAEALTAVRNLLLQAELINK